MWQRKKILNESVQSQLPVQSATISWFLDFADEDLHQVCTCRFAH